MKRYYGVTTKCPECDIQYPEQDCGHQALELKVLRIENEILKNRETWALRAIEWRMARVAELEANVQSLAGWEAKAQTAGFRIRELEAALKTFVGLMKYCEYADEAGMTIAYTVSFKHPNWGELKRAAAVLEEK